MSGRKKQELIPEDQIFIDNDGREYQIRYSISTDKRGYEIRQKYKKYITRKKRVNKTNNDKYKLIQIIRNLENENIKKIIDFINTIENM